MKKFRHRRTGDIATMKSNNSSFYTYDGLDIHARIVEASNDWEEIKEEYPKIIAFRSKQLDTIYERRGEYFFEKDRTTGSITEHFLLQPFYEIYQVAIDKDTIFTVGDRVKVTKLPWTAGEITKFDINKIYLNPTCIGVYIGNSNYGVTAIEKVKSPILITEDKVEIYERESFYNLNITEWTYSKLTASQLYTGPYPTDTVRFASKEKMLEYIDENKPSFSKKQILEAIECKGTSYCEINIWKAFFKQKLGL